MCVVKCSTIRSHDHVSGIVLKVVMTGSALGKRCNLSAVVQVIAQRSFVDLETFCCKCAQTCT